MAASRTANVVATTPTTARSAGAKLTSPNRPLPPIAKEIPSPPLLPPPLPRQAPLLPHTVTPTNLLYLPTHTPITPLTPLRRITMVHPGAYLDVPPLTSAHRTLACLQLPRTRIKVRHCHNRSRTRATTMHLRPTLSNRVTHRVSIPIIRRHPIHTAGIMEHGTDTAITHHHKDPHRRMRVPRLPLLLQRFRTNQPRHLLRNPVAAPTPLHDISIRCARHRMYSSCHLRPLSLHLCLMVSATFVSIGHFPFVRLFYPRFHLPSCSIQPAHEPFFFAYFCVHVLLLSVFAQAGPNHLLYA